VGFRLSPPPYRYSFHLKKRRKQKYPLLLGTYVNYNYFFEKKMAPLRSTKLQSNIGTGKLFFITIVFLLRLSLSCARYILYL